MPTLPPVAVTATTEIIRGALRVRVNAAYTTALRGAGLLPFVLPVLDPADAGAALDGVAGLVLTGGVVVTPGRYGSEPHPRVGGTLVQDVPSEWTNPIVHDGDWARTARVHEVDVTPGSRLARALGTERPVVNSMHHQAVGAVAPSLATVARAPDGIVEGVEWPTDDWWMVGVQWHPEELTASPEPWDRSLLSTFADVVSRAGRLS
jgi:putative glutamine amidotransferase